MAVEDERSAAYASARARGSGRGIGVIMPPEPGGDARGSRAYAPGSAEPGGDGVAHTVGDRRDLVRGLGAEGDERARLRLRGDAELRTRVGAVEDQRAAAVPPLR